VADVDNVPTAGMSGFILSSGEEMEREGHSVCVWFRDQLMPTVTSPPVRRLFIPWLILAKVVRATFADKHFDIVEIHEPLAGPYSLVARYAGSPRCPPCAVLSFGLEQRGWGARIEQLRAQGRAVPLRSRVTVPLTVISQASLALRNADTVLVPSSVDREYLLDRGSRAERVSCCYTGVSESDFSVQPVAHDDVRLLFLGSWIERKGVFELTTAWRRLAAERNEVRLTIAGVGDAQRASADLDGLPRVHLIETVEREDLAALLAAHDLFVLPSSFEGMPLSMLEAAAAGLPCVVCAICGNLDVFRPDNPQRDGAILIPPNDAEGLYRALITLVDDRELRATLGARARERARHFTWARSAHQALNAYLDALDRRAQSASPSFARIVSWLKLW
jgi:glycosyltransferase involved in cell wall biosynthesis